MSIAILGAGIAGCSLALELADRGERVVLFDRRTAPLQEASRWCEGKIHLGLVYANDPSFRTASTMIDGALTFRQTLQRWVDLHDLAPLLSDPFVYAIPHDTLLPVEQIEAHFAAVEAYAQQRMTQTNGCYVSEIDAPLFRRVDPLVAGFDPQRIAATFQTAERAVDCHLLADLLTAAVQAHPHIELRMDTEVLGVEARGAAWSVDCATALAPAAMAIPLAVGTDNGTGRRSEGPFRHVVNALWANRVVIDARMGRPPARRWINRLKLGINITGARCDLGAPSTTFVLGPYGDIVRFQSGRSYLSWYPAGMFAATDALEPIDWQQRLAAVDCDQVTRDTVAALQRLVPALPWDADAEVVVEGGAIFAWGASDIDDIGSELHQRFDIGPQTDGGYTSLDSGKLTTAPQFALQVAELISPAHARQRIHLA